MAAPQSRDRQAVDLQVAEKAHASGDVIFAGKVCERVLAENPHNIEAVILMAKILMDSEKSPIAMAFAEKAIRIAPDDWRAWLLLGMCESSLVDSASMDSLEHANKLSPNNPAIMRSLAFAHSIHYRFAEAEKWAKRALALEEHPQGHVALGFSYLHQGRYGEGWDEYAYGMGHQTWRPKQSFGLPEWNGEEGRLLVYAEQGLGDQIAYCSTLRDANVSQLVCHPKLEKLFKGNFGFEVYGDQFNKELKWQPDADYQVSMSGLQRFFRRDQASFPGTPYLTAHPQKAFQWKALLRAHGPRKKIGVGWTGGVVGSHGWQSRCLELKDFAPVFELDADFVSLEYREHDDSGALLDFDWATRTENYEDCAALMASLDAVICVPTTAYHLAGAMGIPAVVLVHDTPHFHEKTPWWNSVEFIDREGDYMKKAVERLRVICGFSSE